MMPCNKDDETKQPIAVSMYIIAFLYNIVNSSPKLTPQVQHLVTKKRHLCNICIGVIYFKPKCILLRL